MQFSMGLLYSHHGACRRLSEFAPRRPEALAPSLPYRSAAALPAPRHDVLPHESTLGHRYSYSHQPAAFKRPGSRGACCASVWAAAHLLHITSIDHRLDRTSRCKPTSPWPCRCWGSGAHHRGALARSSFVLPAVACPPSASTGAGSTAPCPASRPPTCGDMARRCAASS